MERLTFEQAVERKELAFDFVCMHTGHLKGTGRVTGKNPNGELELRVTNVEVSGDPEHEQPLTAGDYLYFSPEDDGLYRLVE